MGTAAYVELWSKDPASADALIKQVQAEFERINQLMSPYIASSELSILNAKASSESISVSPELFQLLQRAAEISTVTKGAFDITFASVGFYYDYRQHKKPDASQLQQAKQLINYNSVLLTAPNQVRYAKQGVKVDLGGIAKGYAVEQAIQLLAKAGVKHALVTAGGDTRLLGDKLGFPWLVAIKHPRQEDRYAAQLPLIDTAISTSGDYERYFIEDGVRYHHIIDPSTGKSSTGLLSVSVIGADTTYTDALSTSLFVLGLQQGMQLIETLADYEAIFIDENKNMHFSSGLAQD
ncbi:thiamine biosynthesis protein ApbE [Rheinheimera salexigens]|uniref:FAD:protein FMN transferase n=2 Tax=Rheinheimera salexigens TaxID=1628148 RepID=A0A1E7QAN2_9GAMM|nr:thiamine biosynthesis protein ApbE [Rheinheimera salexigens]